MLMEENLNKLKEYGMVGHGCDEEYDPIPAKVLYQASQIIANSAWQPSIGLTVDGTVCFEFYNYYKQFMCIEFYEDRVEFFIDYNEGYPSTKEFSINFDLGTILYHIQWFMKKHY